MLCTKEMNRRAPHRGWLESLEPRLLLTAGPSLPGAAAAQAALSDNQKFVNEAYHDLLNRVADAGGLAYWVAQLNAGAPQGAIADALTHSAEYYSTIIKPAYENYLGRTADTDGLAYWISQMQSGLTDEQLEAGFIGSSEFYAHAGGSDVKWVDAMYTDLLGRPADAQGQSYWVSQLAAGASRSTVAYGFADSLERERQHVDNDYVRYLNRTADQQGVDYWVSQFAQGLTNEDLIAGFVGSTEYYARAVNAKLNLSAHLPHDTGASASDGITSDPTIAGQIVDTTAVTTFVAGFDGAATTSYVNVLSNLTSGDSFSLTRAQLATIFGGALADGQHTLHLVAGDAPGDTANLDIPFTLDTQPPVISITSPADNLTTGTNVTVVGQASDATSGVAQLQTAIDNGPFSPVAFAASGQFSVSTQLAVDGTADGPHVIHFQATDVAGNVSSVTDLHFTLLTKPPAITAFDLSPGSETGTPGDHTTSDARVTLIGQTNPGDQVSLTGLGLTALASADGSFTFPDISLTTGDNSFIAKVSDTLGRTAQATLTVHRVATSGQTDPVIQWNGNLLAAIRQDASDPNIASRGMAMVQSAVYDAVNAVEGKPGHFVTVAAPSDSSAPAAVSQAAHDVLAYLYPAQQATFDTELAASLADVPDGQSKTDGESVGKAAAAAIIALRADDGWNNSVDYTPGSGPGVWQPTAPGFAPALEPQWAQLTPWTMTSDSEFRPAGPPALSSAAWAQDVNETESLGAAGSTTRTTDQTQIAHFWSDGAGTSTPPGHWNEIAEQVATSEGNSLDENARLFAELDVGLADAAVVAWDAKYTYNAWRPITAIQNANSAGNSAVTQDPNWTPLLITPNFPEYVSGHSTFSGTAAGILDAVFGANTNFTIGSDALTGVTRSFTGFDQAAQEAGMSRIYAGIHFLFSDTDGLAAGAALAQHVLATFSTSQDTVPPTITITNPANDSATAVDPTITGHVTDNLSGTKSLVVSFDGGTSTAVTFDAAGNFTVPTSLPLDGTADGMHTLALIATDFAGNVSPVASFSFTLDTKPPAITLTAPTDGAAVTAGSALQGTVATGSSIVALSYTIDGGTTMPIAYDTMSNMDSMPQTVTPPPLAFSQPLDLSKLAAGNHTVVVSAEDAAGNTSQQTVHFALAAAIPLSVTTFTPASGSGDVGVTYRPQIFFSRAIDPTTLTAADFFATDSTGSIIPATIVPSNDGTFAWLFFTNPMPGASTVTITVDGSQIKAADGSLLDAAGDGTPGSKLTWSFTTVSTAPVPGTSLTGIVADPGPDLKPGTTDDVAAGPDHVLMTADDIYKLPIAGAKVYILGHEDQAVYTAADGSFTLSPIPSGDVKLAIDGMTATNPPAGYYFANMVMDLHIQPGVKNTVMAAMADSDAKAQANTELGVYLPRLQTSLLKVVNNTQGATIAVDPASAPDLSPDQQKYLSISVPAGSMVGPDGKPLASAQVGISTVPTELVRDMLPSGLLQLAATLTLQAPDVTVFTSPVTLTFPNVYGAAPGTKLDFYSFDHTTGRLVITGTATVSADGKSATTDPGNGIIHPGWFGVSPPGGPVGGGGGGPRGPNGPNTPDNKCKELGNLAAVTAVEATANTVASLIEVAPIVGCGVSLGLTAIGAVAEYAVAPSQFTATSLGYDVLGGLIGCVPFGIGSVAGIVYSWDFQFASSLKNYHDCLYPSSSAPISMAMAQGFAPAGTFDNPFLDQARVLTESANLYSLFLGSADWTMATPAELPKLNAFFAELQRDMAPGSDGGATITAAEAARLAALPLPASVSSADEQALVARMGHFFKGEFSAIGFDPQAFSTAAQALEQDLSALESQGWQTVFDGFKIGLEELSQLIDASAGGSTGSMGVGAATVQGAPMDMAAANTPPVLATSPLGLYWRITNMSNGFEIRGKFAPTQSTFDGTDIFLAPDTPYAVEYVDPTTLDYAATVFISSSSGKPTQIPLAAFSTPPDTTDTDGDGIPNIDEAVIGTDPTKYSTAGDGISDLAKIQQGLDPLGNRPVVTGVVADLPLPGTPLDVVLDGSTVDAQRQIAYVATGGYGLAIVDVSQFQRPVILSQLALPGNATSVSIDDSLKIAAVADGSAGLVLVDVSNPAAPQITNRNSNLATQVIATDGIAYTASGTDVESYDMLTGERLQDLALGGGTIVSLVRDGSFLYSMDSGNTLRVIDIGQRSMVARGSLTLAAADYQIFVGGGVAYVTAYKYLNGNLDFNGGYATVDVSDPDNLKLIAASAATSGNAPAPSIALNGSGLAVLTPGGVPFTLQVYDVSDPTKTGAFLTSMPLSSPGVDVAIGGGIAFVTEDTEFFSGLEVVNYLPFDTKGVAPKVSVNFNALDIDPNTPGIQVVEGSHISLSPTVTDDVQVRNVELLVNGQVVANEVSYPFDLSTFLPNIATAGNTVTIEVRATDTGGNTGTTGPITLNLVRDTTPPAIVQTDPPAGATRSQQFRTVTIDFSKPIDPATITAASIAVTGPGVSLTPQSIEFRFNDTEVELTYPPATLPVGSYQLVVHAASITDMAGNALGTADIVSSFTIAGNVDEWINPAGGNWSVPANWSTGQVPQTGDDVVIDVPGAPTITYDVASGTTVLHSLLSKDPFTISTGTLTATQSIEVDSPFTLEGDGRIKNTVILPGTSGQVLTVIGPFATLDGVTSNADLIISGNLSIINGLTLNGTAHLEQASSQQLSFIGTQTIAGTGTFVLGSSGASFDVSGSGGPATLTIGPGITIHGQRASFVPQSGSSIINQGTIAADAADVAQLGIRTDTGFSNQGTMRVTGGGTLQLTGAWSNLAGGTISADASTLDLGDAATGGGNGAWANAGTITASNGSTVNLGGTFTLGGLGNFTRTGSTVNLAGTLDDTNATLAMSAATTGAWNVRYGTIKGGIYTSADGTGLVFAGGIGTLDGVTLNSNVDFSDSTVTVLDGLTLNATAELANAGTGGAAFGGALNFSGTQTLAGSGSIAFGGSSPGQVTVASGTVTIVSGITIRGLSGQVSGSFVNQGTIDADGAGALITMNSNVPNGPSGTLSNQGLIEATNGGEIDLSGTWINASGASITADAGTLGLAMAGATNLGTISSLNGSTVNFTFGTFTLAQLGNFQRSGGNVNLQGTLNNTGGTLALDAASGSWNLAGGTIQGGTYTAAGGVMLIVAGGAQATLDGVTVDGDVQVSGANVNGASSLTIKDGVTLNGSIELGATTTSSNVLISSGTQTLGGTGSIVFGSGGGGINRFTGTLTVGPGISVHGQSGSIFGSVINQGTIAADTAGGTILINTSSFTNQGTLLATDGGSLNVASGLVLPMTGTISAGAGGTVNISGPLTLATASTVDVELGGTAAGQFGQITISGAATLDGTLNLALVNGFQPASGNSFKVLTFASSTGHFATVNGTSLPNNLVLTTVYDTGDLTLQVGPAPAGSQQLAALSGTERVPNVVTARAAQLNPTAVDRVMARMSDFGFQ